MTEYRASFDATVTFANGGGLTAQGFRVDVPSPGTGEAEIAALFVASLGLLMTESVELSHVEIIAEAHKGTRGGPSDRAAAAPSRDGTLVELSHVIRAGMITYPGLPGPEITPHLTREASRSHYSPGTEFAIGRISLVGNTGTYLDSPYHRYAGGADLAAMPLERTADLPAVVVRATGAQRRGIDAVNIDDTADGRRPAHSLLLAAGIPVVEHLTGLGQLPPAGARFTAAPLRIEGFGTIPVRAFARLPE